MSPLAFQKIYTIRNDVRSWDELLNSKKKIAPTGSQLIHTFLIITNTCCIVERIWKPKVGYKWSELRDRLMFLSDFAKDCNFDPLIPENWYSVSSKAIIEKVCRLYIELILIFWGNRAGRDCYTIILAHT